MNDQHEFNPRVEKLKDFGFIEAGKAGGVLSSFKIFLDLIYSGKLLDKDAYKPLTSSEKEKINSEIEAKQKTIVIVKSDQTELHSEVVKNKERTEELKDVIYKYESGGISKDGLSSEIEIFNLPKFIVTSFFLIMLSIFIFLFYIAVVYKAIFINTQDIAQSMTEGQWGVSLLPKWYEIQEALQNNKMVIFAPFIFFGFGYALHIFLEQENKLKYLWIVLTLAITLLLDYLLANQIHERINDALDLIGMEPTNKFEDILLVLIMGFVVYIIWSVIFHTWFNELNKRNIPNRLGKMIRKLKAEKDDLLKEIGLKQKEEKSLEEEIRSLTQSLNGTAIPISKIVESLHEFTQGWMSFLVGLPKDIGDQRIEEVEDYLEKFKNDQNLINLKTQVRS